MGIQDVTSHTESKKHVYHVAFRLDQVKTPRTSDLMQKTAI